MLAGLFQHRGELAELGFHRTEHLPHLAAALLDRERAETHAQAVEHGQQRGRSGQCDLVLGLDLFEQARLAQHFGIQALGGQEQDRKVGRVRCGDVFGADVRGFGFDPPHQRLSRAGLAGRIGTVLRVQQALEILAWKLGVDRQQYLGHPIGTGQPDREFHAFVRARHGGDVAGVLIGRQGFLQQRRQLRFAENTPRLDVGEDPLQVPHAGRQRLHLAEAPLHRLQPLGDLGERLGEPGFQRGLQFLVHRGPHLLQLRRVVILQGFKLPIQGAAYLGDPLLVDGA